MDNTQEYSETDSDDVDGDEEIESLEDARGKNPHYSIQLNFTTPSHETAMSWGTALCIPKRKFEIIPASLRARENAKRRVEMEKNHQQQIREGIGDTGKPIFPKYGKAGIQGVRMDMFLQDLFEAGYVCGSRKGQMLYTYKEEFYQKRYDEAYEKHKAALKAAQKGEAFIDDDFDDVEAEERAMEEEVLDTYRLSVHFAAPRDQEGYAAPEKIKNLIRQFCSQGAWSWLHAWDNGNFYTIQIGGQPDRLAKRYFRLRQNSNGKIIVHRYEPEKL